MQEISEESESKVNKGYHTLPNFKDMTLQNGNEENLTLKDLLQEIKCSKEEVKNCISATEVRLLLEIQALKNKNEALVKENEILKERIEKTEKHYKKNNIIIFGLNRENKLAVGYLCEQINHLLDVQIEPREISDCYALGREERSPIKVEFISYQSKKTIFKNIKKLKDTGVAIANDLTLRQRQDLKKLKTFLREARSKYSEKSYIKGDKLIIGEKSFTLEELENPSEKVAKANSAPNTPSLNYRIDEDKEDEEENTLTSEEEPEEAKIQGKDRKIQNTPHLPTHKKVYPNAGRPPPKKNNSGMKLRVKSTTEKKN